MVEMLRDMILEKIKDLPESEQQSILLELSGDLAIMAESYM